MNLLHFECFNLPETIKLSGHAIKLPHFSLFVHCRRSANTLLATKDSNNATMLSYSVYFISGKALQNYSISKTGARNIS